MARGLSPLARGNHDVSVPITQTQGPIPARAGEPGADLVLDSFGGAYPRSRGGTTVKGELLWPEMGLSPLARGNPAIDAWFQSSIGLSPLARGNPERPATSRASRGPIPARAGEPWAGTMQCASSWAYPRSRGGTTRGCFIGSVDEGLSPLARGNRWLCRDSLASVGPIPAGAGEPSSTRQRQDAAGAYPRSRGGTPYAPARRQRLRGLSPLSRGNLNHAQAAVLAAGPIPARAGEPFGGLFFRRAGRAYPRSRGGTSITRGAMVARTGLSPLARGNLRLG